MDVHPLDNLGVKLLQAKLCLDGNGPHEVLAAQHVLEGLALEVAMLGLPLLDLGVNKSEKDCVTDALALL